MKVERVVSRGVKGVGAEVVSVNSASSNELELK